jgi:hypothetical protein
MSVVPHSQDATATPGDGGAVDASPAPAGHPHRLTLVVALAAR